MQVKKLCQKSLFVDEGWKTMYSIGQLFGEINQTFERINLKYEKVYHPKTLPVSFFSSNICKFF